MLLLIFKGIASRYKKADSLLNLKPDAIIPHARALVVIEKLRD